MRMSLDGGCEVSSPGLPHIGCALHIEALAASFDTLLAHAQSHAYASRSKKSRLAVIVVDEPRALVGPSPQPHHIPPPTLPAPVPSRPHTRPLLGRS